MKEVIPLRKYRYIILIIFIIAFLAQWLSEIFMEFDLSMMQKMCLVLLQVLSIIFYTYLSIQKCDILYRKKIMKQAHNVMFVIYLLNFIWILFLDKDFGRNYEILKQYPMINFDIFATLRLFIHGYHIGVLSLEKLCMNIIGNLLIFMPMDYFLVFYFRSQRNSVVFWWTMSLIVVSVEVIQVVIKAGTGDIDDFLLNMIGVLIFFIGLKIGHVERVYERLES